MYPYIGIYISTSIYLHPYISIYILYITIYTWRQGKAPHPRSSVAALGSIYISIYLYIDIAIYIYTSYINVDI